MVSTSHELVVKCIYTNCLSLLNKTEELRMLAYQSEPHIIALTETWLTEEILDNEVNLPGYSIFRADSLRGKTGGVCFYIQSTLPLVERIDLHPPPKYDLLWLRLHLRDKDVLLIGTIYRSPSATLDDDLAFTSSLKGFLTTQRYSHLLLAGDFNIPNVDWSTNSATGPPATFFTQMFTEKGWTQHIRQPTRFREGQRSSLLDLIITNHAHLIDTVHHSAPLGKSDHMTLTFDFICYWTVTQKTSMTLRNFKKADFAGMRSFLSNVRLTGASATENYSQLQSAIELADTHYVPRGVVKPSSRLPLPKRIKRMLDQRSRLFARYMSTNNTDDGAAFRKSRNKCKSEIQKHKRETQSKILSTAATNKTFLFRHLRRLRKQTPTALVLRSGNQPTSDQHEVANIFRDHFASVYALTTGSDTPELSEQDITKPLPALLFTVEEIKSLLKATNCYGAMGPDKIHPRILKEGAAELASLFFDVFRETLTTGKLPDSWKEANITPIFKTGDRLNPASYRPISLTSIPCKIMERILKKRILTHLTENGLISPLQHGFLPGRSCITNMLLFTDSLTQARDEGKISDAIFFDFAKAFDKVQHKLLLHKLQVYGIEGMLLNWIQSFLTGRTFKVKVGSTLSDSAPVESGVPQGSVLGPLLFLIYINDLPRSINNNCLLYADDLKIWASGDSVSLQTDINAVQQWSDKWNLPINASKCVHLSFGGDSRNSFTFQDGTGEMSIQKLETKKDLGILLSWNLTFSKHHQDTARKAFRVLHMIKRAFPVIGPKDFPTIFCVYVRPILEYASSVVYSSLKKDIQCIEKVQRVASKMVQQIRNLPYQHRLTALKVFPLDIRRLRGDLILVYTLFTAGRERDFFQLAHTDNLRGNGKKLFKPQCRTLIRQSSFSHRTINAWNQLPQAITDAPSKDSFKLALDVHLGLHKAKLT